MTSSYTDKLNAQQKEAVLTTQGPVLILAGAGSGKTRVITNRIAYLIKEQGVSPYEIMAITFTNKAAAEMKERIVAQTGAAAAGSWISTFHSACLRILRMYGHFLGYEDGITIYDRDDSISVIKKICKDLKIDTKRFKEKWFLNRISAAKDELVSADDFAQEASDYHEKKAAQVYLEYEKELKKKTPLILTILSAKQWIFLKKSRRCWQNFRIASDIFPWMNIRIRTLPSSSWCAFLRRNTKTSA